MGNGLTAAGATREETMMSMWRTCGAASLVAVILLLTALTAGAQPVNIRVSWVAVPNNLPPFMFKKPGIPKHYGKSYTMEAVQYRGTPQSVTALATRDLDIALLSYSSFPLAIQNANMQDLRIIADEFQDGAEGYYSAQFMVLKDGPIRTIADVKGKTVAVNIKNGATHGAARSLLGQHGLQERDYSVIEVAFPNMRAVLAEKKVDVVSVGTPQFAFDPDMQKIARTLFTQRDALGKTAVVIWAARTEFLEKNRAAMIDFMEDMLRDRRFLFDPANHGEAVKIVSEFTKIPPDKLDSWLFTRNDFYRDPDARPDLITLQANIDQLHKEGALKQPLDVRKHSDLSYLEEAIKRMK
jgi:sulfonate transport system substrate-binding protein